MHNTCKNKYCKKRSILVLYCLQNKIRYGSRTVQNSYCTCTVQLVDPEECVVTHIKHPPMLCKTTQIPYLYVRIRVLASTSRPPVSVLYNVLYKDSSLLSTSTHVSLSSYSYSITLYIICTRTRVQSPMCKILVLVVY